MTIRIVSTTSEDEIRRRESLDQLKRDLRKFAANFLRLVSKSGRWQMEEVSTAIRQYAEVHDGRVPSNKVVHAILDEETATLEYRPWTREAREVHGARWEAEGEYARAEAISDIVRAGMRMTASTLVDQLTQHNVAESDFYSALDRLEEIRSGRRKALKKKS